MASYKGQGWHKNDYPTKGSKVFTAKDVDKLDKEQKLSLAANLLEKQGVNLEK